MLNRAWISELSEASKYAWHAACQFWANDVWPVLMTFGIFLIFSAPFIILILVLWYLDSIGWKSSAGFYTIGLAPYECLRSHVT